MARHCASRRVAVAGVGDLIAKVVRRATKRIDAVEVRVAGASGQECRGYVEIFVVGRRQALAPGLRLGQRGPDRRRQVLGRCTFERIVQGAREWQARLSLRSLPRSTLRTMGVNRRFDVGRDALRGPSQHAVENSPAAARQWWRCRLGSRRPGSARSAADRTPRGPSRACGESSPSGSGRSSAAGWCRIAAVVPAGGPAEQVHQAALAGHLHRPLPRLGRGHGFDDDVGPAACGCERAGGSNRVGHIRDADHMLRAEVSLPSQPGRCA